MGTMSDRPTNRPPPTLTLVKLYGLAKTWGPVLVSIATAVASAYAFVERELQHRIEAAVEEHSEDRAMSAHPRLAKQVVAVTEELAATRRALDATTAKSDRLYKALYEMYWFRVGEKAIELEPDRRLHARVRARAQRQFAELMKEGETLEDAYRRSLSTAAGLP